MITVTHHAAAIRRVLIVGDIHWAVRDETALSLFESFRRDWKPDEIFITGDAVEFRGISHFMNYSFDDHGNPVRPNPDEIREEVTGIRTLFATWRQDHPQARIHMMSGNHEDRLAKYLVSRAPDLISLPGAFSIPLLFDLPKLQIGWSPYRQGVILPYGGPRGLMLQHGSTNSAQAELNQYRRPGISGHIHKHQTAQYRDWDGSIVRWMTHGCLTNLHPDWCATPHWEHGFGLVEWNRATDSWSAKHVPIRNGGIIWDAQSWDTNSRLESAL